MPTHLLAQTRRSQHLSSNHLSLPRPQCTPLLHATRTFPFKLCKPRMLSGRRWIHWRLSGPSKPQTEWDLEEFLNPAAERDNLFDGTDEDIYQAVMDSKAAREVNKGNSNDSESDESVEPGPTRREALQAVLLLEKYIVHFNDPFMFELGSMLRSFGRRARFLESQAMKDTKITSYFPPK
ncbi:hypothetical protein J3R82DRAFT_4745 [Butyriboletus roseoflavus]|nr:hypothetical protein J3R82DRAFT_4745 [Butyriboletus roseoflavus]